ncbi:MAG: cyanophycinase [Bacteroidota bacterium]
MGYLLLEGGAEFGGSMREPDLKAIDLAGGFDAPIRIIPTAAAPDRNDRNAGNNGIRWFQGLGATNVLSIPVIDKASANNEQNARAFRDAKLIYMLGGFTHYLGQTLKDSLVWQAVLEAYGQGAVIAGSSAGAMVMCQFYYDPGQGQIQEGLNLVPQSLVLPHHDTFGKNWAPRLLVQIPHVTLIGIDEQTGMLSDGVPQWTVYGRGAVTLYSGSQTTIFDRGNRFSL